MRFLCEYLGRIAGIKGGFEIWQTGRRDKTKGKLDIVDGFTVFSTGFHQGTVIPILLTAVIRDCMNEYSSSSFLTYNIPELG